MICQPVLVLPHLTHNYKMLLHYDLQCFFSAVVIGFSEDDYTGDEGEPGDVSRPNTPCTVTVEIIERSLEIPLQIRLTPEERNATSKKV